MKMADISKMDRHSKRRKTDHAPARSTGHANESVTLNKPEEKRYDEAERRDEGRPDQTRHIQRRETKSQTPKGAALSSLRSDLFNLQIEELLTSLRPDYGGHMARAEAALHRLKQEIEKIPNRDPVPVSQIDEEFQKSNIKVPFPLPRPSQDVKIKFAYSKPTSINVVGSYSLRTAIRSEELLGVDLAVTMPAHLFQEKDFLNFRYFHKRAYYLACIAAGLNAVKDLNFDISFAFQNDNQLQPIIEVESLAHGGKDDFSKCRCKIRVILAAPEDVFDMSKTYPGKNCVRMKGDKKSSAEVPTPFYNASLRSECSTLSYLKLLHKAAAQSDGFRGACMLGTVWLRQRDLGSTLAKGGFGHFEWAATMALLMQGGGYKGKPLLLKGYSASQLFKATLQFLASVDLVNHPVSVPAQKLHSPEQGTPVLFHGSTGLNLYFKMSLWSYIVLRYEASVTLDALNGALSNRFDSCFIIKVAETLQRFDFTFSLQSHFTGRASPADLIGKCEAMISCHRMFEVLKTGLGDRVSLINIKLPAARPWPIHASQPDGSNRKALVGVLLNADQAMRAVDKGPPAEDKHAVKAFQKFWGEKAELRRFNDGSILECVTWLDNHPSKVSQIISYVTQRHLGQDITSELDSRRHGISKMLPTDEWEAKNSFQAFSAAFEILEKDIRNLEGLPLHIRQVQAASPSLRYSSVEAHKRDSNPGSMKPIDIHVQFEGSARWPDSLAAIQRTKIAFLLKMGELLEEAKPGLRAKLGLENTASKLLNIAFLDIHQTVDKPPPASVTFRLRIHHEREATLLERELKDNSYSEGKSEETALALSTYKRQFVQGPLHTQAVRMLSTRFPALSGSMRLMKMWRDSHLLTFHINDELIELLTVRVFVTPYPWQAPGSPTTGFLRTLHLISRWDWRSEPLIVDFNGELTAKDVEAITLGFEAWRKVDPAMNRVAMFVGSNLDPSGTTWVEHRPLKVVAAHLTELAKSACKMVREQNLDLDPSAMFTPSTADFDFVIHIYGKFVRGREQEKSTEFKNLQLQASDHTSVAPFEAVELFLEELQRLYGTNVLFFYGASGASVVAGLWNPRTGPRPWKVNMAYSTEPGRATDGTASIAINKSATLYDIALLGGDLVSRIEVRS